MSFFLQNKVIQCVPTPAYSSKFVIYAPSFTFLNKLFLEKPPLISVHFYNIFVFQNLLKDEAALKISFFPFLIPETALAIPFPVNKFPNRLAPKVTNNMLKNPPSCSFVSFLIVSVTHFSKILESSRA